MHAASVGRGAQSRPARERDDDAEWRAAVEYASLRPDKAANPGIGGRPRSAHAVYARGDAGEVSARAGACVVAKFPGVEGGRISYRDGPGEKFWPGICARVFAAGTEGVGGDRGQ